MMPEAMMTRFAGEPLAAPATETDHAERSHWLLCRAGHLRCALPIGHVIEIMRPLPVERIAGAPHYIRGLSIVHGVPVAVVDLGLIVGNRAATTTRVVTVLSFLEEVLRRRIGELASSSADYLAKLVHEKPHAESAALAEELTVAETYFFRHNDQFRSLAEFALPDRMRARAAGRTLNLMSAGCASGEEAYSIAIVVRETITDPSWNVMIQAVDLNRAVLQKAEKARYSAWALRETPLPVREKWFHYEGRELILDEPLRRAVHFKHANLASDDPVLWQAAVYDVIFCRNVLMYFAPDRMRAAIARIAASLAPGRLPVSRSRRNAARRFRRL